MGSTKPQPKLLVIVGPTASGKSELAMRIAKKFNGEIISADSRTIYKGFDIGTAKPSKNDLKTVAHWGIDLVRPDEKFNVAKFKRYAEQKIEEIYRRKKLPILVGGSGLYIDSILFQYQFSHPGSLRDEQNPRHLKKSNDLPLPKKLRGGSLIIGLNIDKELLKQRLEERVNKMLEDGFIKEIKELSTQYKLDSPAFLAPGYRAFREYLEGQVSLEEAKLKFIQNDLSLSRRQRTWFKRNPHINWFNDSKTAYKFIEKSLLNN